MCVSFKMSLAFQIAFDFEKVQEGNISKIKVKEKEIKSKINHIRDIILSIGFDFSILNPNIY